MSKAKNIAVFYLGVDGYGNYGDDYGQDIIRLLGFKFSETSDRLLIGVGTLFPLDKYLRDKIKNKNFKEIIVYGTGCRDPVFEKDKKQFEKDMKYTRELLKKASFIGVRDEFTAKTLGVGEVIGDPFFCVKPPKKKKGKYVVLNIGRSSFSCWGEVDGELDTLKNIIKFTKKFIMDKHGLRVVVLPLFVNDRTLSASISSYLGCMREEFHDFEKVMELFAHAEYCITYKLHGMIAALLTNTPVIALEYKPKVRNVGKDFGIEKFILRTDEVTEESLLEKYKLLKTWDSEVVNKKRIEYAKKQYYAMRTLKNMMVNEK